MWKAEAKYRSRKIPQAKMTLQTRIQNPGGWDLLGGSRVVPSRVISRVTILITHIRGIGRVTILITLLITTPEPPSRCFELPLPGRHMFEQVPEVYTGSASTPGA